MKRHLNRTRRLQGCRDLCCCLATVLVLLTAVQSTCGADGDGARDGQVRVAFGDFNCDDNYVRSRITLGDIESTLQARLQSLPGVEWVERGEAPLLEQELRRGVAGWVDGASTLRLGKWLKADYLVLGRFRHLPDVGHELLLEIVEVDRADVLATRRLELAGDSRDPVSMSAGDITLAAAAIKSALDEAREVHSQNVGTKVVAPLFFRNTDPAPRLSGLEQELESQFVQQGERTPGVRVVRFPRAVDASQEVELALRGLAESDPDAWQKVADTYVWGTFHELPAEGTPFEKTPIEITLNVWNGAGQPVSMHTNTIVQERTGAVVVLVHNVLDLANQGRAKADSAMDRREVADWLRARARAVQSKIRKIGTGAAGFRATDEGGALQRQLICTLETASFFSPEDCELRVQRLLAVWPNFPYASGTFLEYWKLVEDLDELAEECGYTGKRVAGRDLANDCRMAWEHVLYRCQYSHLVPIDATAATIEEWRAYAQDRLKYIAARSESLHAAKPLSPALVQSHPQRLSRTNLSQRSAASTTLQPPTADTYEIPMPALPPDPDALGMVQFHPFIRPISILPRVVSAVTALAEVDYAIWVAMQVSAQALRNVGIEWVPTVDSASDKIALLFRWDPAQNTSELVSRRLRIGSRITDLLANNDLLWFATANDGVWQLVPETLETRQFGIKDGLLTPNLDAVSGTGDRIYCSGEREGAGLVSIFDQQSNSWTRLNADVPGNLTALGFGVPRSAHGARMLVAHGHWLLLGPNPLSLVDTRTGHLQRLTQKLGLTDFETSARFSRRARRAVPAALQAYVPPGQPLWRSVSSGSAGPRGFWLTTNWELIFLEPESGDFTVFPSPFPRLSALALDGDYIWVASASIAATPRLSDRFLYGDLGAETRQFSRISLFHRPTGHWLGFFDVPGRVVNILANGPHLYLGLEATRDPLIEVDKRFAQGMLKPESLKAATNPLEQEK